MSEFDRRFEEIMREARAKLSPEQQRVFDASGGHAEDHATRDRLWVGQLRDAVLILADTSQPISWHLLDGFWTRLDDVTGAMFERHKASSDQVTELGGGAEGTMGARPVRRGNASRALHDALTDDERTVVEFLRDRASHSHTNGYEIRWIEKHKRVHDTKSGKPIEEILRLVRGLVASSGGVEHFARALAGRILGEVQALVVELHRMNAPPG